MELEEGDRSMTEVAEGANPWTVFLELLDPEVEASRPLPTFDKDQDVMLFFKVGDWDFLYGDSGKLFCLVNFKVSIDYVNVAS